MRRDERLRALEAEALDEEVARLELWIARVWQLFTILGTVGALVVALFVARTLGLWCAGGGVLFFCWFSTYAELLKRGRTRPAGRTAAVAIESTIPWVFIVVLTHAQNAVYALGSWVPPLLYAAVMVAWMARLRPLPPLVFGIASGAAYPLIYFIVLRHRIDPAYAQLPLYQPTMQLTRGAFVMLGGIMVALITHGLRLVFARAFRKVRAQDLFGKYRLGRRIASGGMATVFEAVYCPEGGFERTVAVKRIHPHLAQRQEFVDSFRIEAELSARLVHPNIVQVLDFGRIDESYFLAMEYVDGLTLRELMRRARTASITIAPKLCAYLAREILAGLSYSHARARDANGALLRVVHRDLSPANVLLSRHGEVKITDFGVAKALRDAAVSETRTVAGHLAYMAPEQAGAQPIDERCDLFAVGVIAWELLCGRPLFLRDGEGPTLMALMHEPIPPPAGERGDIDTGWNDIVTRALARNIDERYRSAEEMAADVAALPEAQAAGAGEAIAALVAELKHVTVPAERDPVADRPFDTNDAPTRVLRDAHSG